MCFNRQICRLHLLHDQGRLPRLAIFLGGVVKRVRVCVCVCVCVCACGWLPITVKPSIPKPGQSIAQ